MGVGPGFAALDGHTATNVRTGRVGREIQIKQVASERRTVRGLAAEQGKTARILCGTIQLSASLASSTLASVLIFTPWLMIEAEMYTHAQPSTGTLGVGRSASVRAEIFAVNTGNVEGVVCADNVVRQLLPVGGQVAIGQVVTGQTLVFHDTSVVENRERDPWESAHVDLVGRQTRRRADGMVEGEFYVGQIASPNRLVAG